MENTGSLTGHILSHGHPETQQTKAGTARVVIIMTVALCTIVIAGLLLAIVFRDSLQATLSSFFGS